MQRLTNGRSDEGVGRRENQVATRPDSREQKCLEQIVPDYAFVFFDHIYSEYLALKPTIPDQQLTGLLDAIHKKRLDCKLTWSDIYSFDLTLVRARKPESLIRKAYDARAKYRSIAGQKEYDEYTASRPPNLTDIKVEPHAEPPQPGVVMENLLRADLEYLLSKFYLYYAMLPMREHLRDQLTRRAVRTTGIWVVVLAVLIILNVSTAYLLNLGDIAAGLTVLAVALAGVIGGCVSMLQRIQSAPTEGDALFNLASLNNGWTGLSLSPLYGGIFASLLFVLFAAGILKGSVFPEIHTPGKPVTSAASSATTPASTPSVSPIPSTTATPAPLPGVSTPQSPTPTTSPTATPVVVANAQNTRSPAAGESPVNPTVKAATSPTPTPAEILRVRRFLKETGPVDGVAYALLIVWSFIAGFAERLVPDTLNRLVAKNEAIQGK